MTTTTTTTAKKEGAFTVFIYLYVVHFFAWCYHANETSSAVPLNGTMYLIVSFYASWREGQGGKRSVFQTMWKC